MTDNFLDVLADIEKLIEEGKLDEAKEKIVELMGNKNLSDTLNNVNQ